MSICCICGKPDHFCFDGGNAYCIEHVPEKRREVSLIKSMIMEMDYHINRIQTLEKNILELSKGVPNLSISIER